MLQRSLKYSETPVAFILLAIITIFVWPFGVCLISLYFFRTKWAKIYITFFIALFGYCLIAQSDELDLYRYLSFLPYFVNIPNDKLLEILLGEYSTSLGTTGGVDFYRDIVAFLVSRFTDNSLVLMMTFAVVYGYLLVLSLECLDSRKANSNGKVCLLLLICFFSILGLRGIAGVRFQTAALLFYIGVWKLLNKSGSKSYLIILSTLLIHFSFVLPVVLLIMSFLFKNKRTALLVLLAASLVIRLFNIDILLNYVYLFQSFYGDRIELYTNDEGIASDLASFNSTVWFVANRISYIINYSYLFIFLFVIKRKTFLVDSLVDRLFDYSILLLVIVNITHNIPILNERLNTVFLLFFISFVYCLYTLNESKKTIKNITLGLIFMFTLNIMYEIRSVFYITSPYLYIGNLYSIFNRDTEITVWELLTN